MISSPFQMDNFYEYNLAVSLKPSQEHLTHFWHCKPHLGFISCDKETWVVCLYPAGMQTVAARIQHPPYVDENVDELALFWFTVGISKREAKMRWTPFQIWDFAQPHKYDYINPLQGVPDAWMGSLPMIRRIYLMLQSLPILVGWLDFGEQHVHRIRART